jgi:hypothetical protein
MVVEEMVVQSMMVLLMFEVKIELALMVIHPAVVWVPKAARQAPEAQHLMLSCLTPPA